MGIRVMRNSSGVNFYEKSGWLQALLIVSAHFSARKLIKVSFDQHIGKLIGPSC